MHAYRIIQYFLFSTILSASSLAFADPISHEVVARKFSKDKASFAQFLFFGKLHCLDKYFGPPGDFVTAYGIAYNYLYPLPRIFKREAFDDAFEEIESKKLDKKLFRPQNAAAFTDPLEICRNIYQANTKNLGHFVAFVSQRGAVHSSAEVDVEINMQDYLKGFFVRTPQ